MVVICHLSIEYFHILLWEIASFQKLILKPSHIIYPSPTAGHQQYIFSLLQSLITSCQPSNHASHRLLVFSHQNHISKLKLLSLVLYQYQVQGEFLPHQILLFPVDKHFFVMEATIVALPALLTLDFLLVLCFISLINIINKNFHILLCKVNLLPLL